RNPRAPTRVGARGGPGARPLLDAAHAAPPPRDLEGAIVARVGSRISGDRGLPVQDGSALLLRLVRAGPAEPEGEDAAVCDPDPGLRRRRPRGAPLAATASTRGHADQGEQLRRLELVIFVAPEAAGAEPDAILAPAAEQRDPRDRLRLAEVTE